ncbi:MAG: hypothetical protein J0L78_04295 [Planctomycetes bacterium]|nr:hypothetical protein [Planctomycetota bacterium]
MWPFGRKKPHDPALQLVFVPSLVSILWHHEQEKGSALTETEVLAIRDKAIVIALRMDEAHKITQARGYTDIVSENCWRDWCAVREQLRLDEVNMDRNNPADSQNH